MSKGTFTLVKQMKLFTHQKNVFPRQWDSNADFSTCGFPAPGDHCPPSWNPTEKWQRNVKIQSVPQCIIWAARYQVQFVHFSNFRHDNFNNVTEVSFNICSSTARVLPEAINVGVEMIYSFRLEQRVSSSFVVTSRKHLTHMWINRNSQG